MSLQHIHQPTSETPHQTSYFQIPVQPICQSSYQPFPYAHPCMQHSHPEIPLHKYANFLRLQYTKPFTSAKWPFLHARNFVNLAVISSKYAKREDLVEFRELTIRGCIDDILEWKGPIWMKDILKPNCIKEYDFKLRREVTKEYPVTQLLIEGAPGIGKSTFAWEVCQKWAQHQLFNEYSLVVLLKFRDKRVHEANSVSDLFYHPYSNLQSDVVQHICTTNGHGLLLILEGFDEAPASKRTMDSIFVRLFLGAELPKATVILTTRPSASVELRQLCKGQHSRRIEIVGFGKNEIDEYIQCAFSDEQLQSDFKEYLFLYPHIHSMMYVPLNSAIVTHVYESCKSSGIVVPETMTQLYSSLIRTLLLRYLKDKEEYKNAHINSFQDLPQPVYDRFCDICKIAYTGVRRAETELIFQDFPSDFDTLGLMQTCPELYVDRGASVSYNFLHLTFQEYLAAYHISQQNRSEQVAFIKEHIESKKLEVVVRFVAGLSELGTDLWDVVRQFAFTDLLQGSRYIKHKILHCLFESPDSSAIASILDSDHVSFDHNCGNRLQPFDWYVLGYCITHSSHDWNLEFQYFNLESVEAFLKALNLQRDQWLLPSAGKIKEICLRTSTSDAVCRLVDDLPQIKLFHLTHLDLKHCHLTSGTCNYLSKHTVLLQRLEYLNLHCNSIGRGGAVNLITSLSKFSTIRELGLYNTGIGYEDCQALSRLLTNSNYIKVLHVGYNELLHDSILLILLGLFHNDSLEKLEMRYCSNLNVLNLASVLGLNIKLKELYIPECNIQSNDSVHLAEALNNPTTQLQMLELFGNPIGSEGAVAFAGMLATNQSLTKLNISGCSIQGEGAIHLAKAMEGNCTLREFNISDNPIGSEGAIAFADMLSTNKTLAKLDMSGCSIQGGAVCLAKAMEKNSTVSDLVMNYNPLGSEDAAAFASMLKRNQCLKILKLWLYDGSENALELIESLKHNTTLQELGLSYECEPPSFSTLDQTLQDRVTFT